MSRAPGYQRAPTHQIREERFTQPVRVEVNGEVVAESTAVIRVKEDRSPDRYYFPRADVRMDKLERTKTTSHCPFKGTASYYTLNAGGEKLTDAVWSYEDPYEEHRGLKDLLAFYEEKAPQIKIRLAP
jgi:uncharacterized protein (DUF427 family)